MKIIHLSSAITWRGGEQQLAYLYEELNSKNIEQIVLCPENSELYKKFKKKGFEKLIGYKKISSLNIAFALKLKKICRENKVDLIHVHDAHAHTFAFLSALLFFNKTPVIVSRRVDFPIGRSIFSKIKYNHKSIHKIICVSNAIKNIMHKDIKKADKLITIHSGIDTKRFPYQNHTNKLRELLNLDEDTIIIGNTSAIAPHKDYFTFVDTAEIIIEKIPNVHFVILGDGNMHNEISNYIKSKNLQKHFSLLGFRENIHELLPDFDVFLLTSKTEGLGTSILDAFACSIPVVATEAGGITEIVIHNETGLLAQIKNPQQLADNVIKLITDNSLKTMLTRNAKKKLNDFTKQQTATKILEVYYQILRPL